MICFEAVNFDIQKMRGTLSEMPSDNNRPNARSGRKTKYTNYENVSDDKSNTQV